MGFLSETRAGPNEKCLPPNSGDDGMMLVRGPEGGIGGLRVYDNSHLLGVQSCAQHFAFMTSFTFILIL